MSRGIWISAKEAAEIISTNNARVITDQYVRNYAHKGKIRWRKKNERENEYLKSDVDTLRIKQNKRTSDVQVERPIFVQQPLDNVA